ncbi:MAG: 30S ribosomal protein S12 methylthiotransferase RimO [Candidatus Hydrothermota bacterium]|nr:MAG: 30S ribosomal protein S12 methylthiotransferase RimO [Candidatus Hydrothermae bacterium]
MQNLKKVGLISLGCPKARVDSEFFLGKLMDAGYEITTPEDADIVIINTCAFIKPAEDESAEEIKAWLKAKSAGRVQKVGVVGCLVERWRSRLLRRFPDLDFVLGTDEFDLIDTAIAQNIKQIRNTPPQSVPSPKFLPRFLTTFPFAYVKIAEGCNRRCAFCTIPSIRGKHRFRPIEDILDEVASLATIGVKEIILVSQDLTLYPKLYQLIQELESVDVQWIRLLYLHPKGVNKKLVDAMASNPKIVPYVELPIQHISDRILKLMGRAGGEKAVKKAVELLKTRIPEIFIRTEIIVGYPTETDSEFQELLDYIEEVGFERIGVFKFWSEKGTRASKIEPKIPQDLIDERFDVANTVASIIMEKAQLSLLHRPIQTIVDFKFEDAIYGRTIYDAPEIDFKVIFKNFRKVKLGQILTLKPSSLDQLDLVV